MTIRVNLQNFVFCILNLLFYKLLLLYKYILSLYNILFSILDWIFEQIYIISEASNHISISLYSRMIGCLFIVYFSWKLRTQLLSVLFIIWFWAILLFRCINRGVVLVSFLTKPFFIFSRTGRGIWNFIVVFY